jgi:hypothetical protein
VAAGRAAGRAVAPAAALALPVVVAVVALRDPRWHANLDLALTELRVRDVTSGDPPLVGLSGRIEAFGVPGSHPGPISFWLLAPLYRLFGASSWALQAATATLNLVAVAVAVAIGHRRAGRAGALAVALGMAVLLQAYGADRWTQAWNPYLPLLWWPVLLLAVWSVLCDDLPMLPVAVVTGTFCLQTHVSYLGQVAGLLVVAAAALPLAVARGRQERSQLRQAARWWALSAVLAVALWAPPLVEQVRNDPGNLTIIRQQFTHPTQASAGWRTAAEVALHHLDLTTLVTGRTDAGGVAVPGVLLLAAWGAAAVAAWRRPGTPGELRRLHVGVAAALGLGVVSVSRVQGRVFDYLALWLWGTAALTAAAVAWTLIDAWPAGRVDGPRESSRRVVAALGLALAVAVVAATVDAGGARSPQPGQAAIHARLLPEAVAALRAGDAPGGGEDGRYLVRSDDPLSGGLNTYTVLLELERQGLEAGVDPAHALAARPFRVLPAEEATAVVTYVVGPAVESWRDRAGAVEIARAEPATGDRAEYARLRARVIDDLERDGLDGLTEQVDGNLLGLGIDPRLRPATVELLRQMIELSGPTSVFVTAPGS